MLAGTQSAQPVEGSPRADPPALHRSLLVGL